MTAEMVIRIVAGILFACVLGILVMRRRKQHEPQT